MQKYLIFLTIFWISAAVADTHNWMSQIPDNRVINQLIIPGTHDSGTYAITGFSKFSLSNDDPLPHWIEEISNILPISLVRFIVAGWSKTQPYSITDQLNSGIRYLDFRVCDDDRDSHLYLCHALLSVRLNDALQQIQTFVLQNPTEIVIVDINHIYNVDTEAKEAQLVQLLQTTLSTVMIPNTYHATDTMGTLRKTNRQVIVLMDIGQPISDHALQQFATHDVWNEKNIDSPWPNQSNITGLKTTLDAEMAAWSKLYLSANHFFVLQSIQTENTHAIINGIVNPAKYPHTLQSYELPVNVALHNWLSGYITAYGPLPLNIVMQDWFDNTSTLVSLAMQYDAQPLHHPKHTDRDNNHALLSALKNWYLRQSLH